MHSPWGIIYQVAKETGWSWRDILWRVPRTHWLMMMADRPQVREKKSRVVDDKELFKIINGNG